MQQIMDLYNFINTNGAAILAGLAGLWAFAEIVVRLTPTKKDDTVLERVGKVVKKVMNALGLPDRKAILQKQLEAEEKKSA